MKTIKIFIILAIVTSIFSTCYKQPNYPKEPQIDFQQISIEMTSDTLGNKVPLLKIYFRVLDGDGNFGMKDNDTIFRNGDTILNNFYASLFYRHNGETLQIPDSLLLLNGRIPWTAPVGLNDFYKATVIYNLPLSYIFTDTIKFTFYVIDNDLNESNEQSTQWIPPDFTGTLIDTVVIIQE